MNLVYVFRDRAGGWRWQQVASNGKVVADSGEAYTRRWSAKRAATKANPRLSIYVEK